MAQPRQRLPRVLSIAGSDSGGGAGIQADLKAFARCGVHGMTAITAITAQNTVGGDRRVSAARRGRSSSRCAAVVEDIGVDAVKIGMLGNAATIEAVRGGARPDRPDVPVVLDPVMVAESGARLLDEDARAALRELLAAARGGGHAEPARGRGAGRAGRRALAPEELARAVHALGPRVVVVTGGHREEAIDVFFDGDQLVEIPGERHPDGAAHGSGCTHSSALAAHLALGSRSARGGAAGEGDRLGGGGRAGCVGWARGRPGGCARAARPASRLSGLERRPADPAADEALWHNRRPPQLAVGQSAPTGEPIKFLRMKPGHGEVLLAEGDPALREDEERLVEEFRRQLDEGMWAAVPTTEPGSGRREAQMVQAVRRDPARRRARDLLPPRGRRLSRRARMLLALLALALVAAALALALCWRACDRRSAPSAPRGAARRAVAASTSSTTRGASAAPSSARASCCAPA